VRCRRKFLRYFSGDFRDDTYFDWERGYKQKAHERWNEWLHPREFRALLRAKKYAEIARRAVAIEARTHEPPFFVRKDCRARRCALAARFQAICRSALSSRP